MDAPWSTTSFVGLTMMSIYCFMPQTLAVTTCDSKSSSTNTSISAIPNPQLSIVNCQLSILLVYLSEVLGNFVGCNLYRWSLLSCKKSDV